jgi:hypothetical protein
MEKKNQNGSERSSPGNFQRVENLPEQRSEMEAPNSPKRVYPKKKRSGLNPFFRRGPLAA